jgi:hypothetical protein
MYCLGAEERANAAFHEQAVANDRIVVELSAPLKWRAKELAHLALRFAPITFAGHFAGVEVSVPV